ncbi:MAG: ABC transporter permease [Flexilinea sp.]
MKSQIMNKKKPSQFVQTIFNKYGMLLVFVLLCIVMSFSHKTFMTMGNWQNLVRQISVNGILAMGMTFVILTGGIDLSVGSMIAVSGVVAAKFLTDYPDTSMFVALLFALGICCCFGACYGSIIAQFGLPPFVVTLSIMQIARGFALVYSDGKPIIIYDDAVRSLGQGKLFGVLPVPVIIFLCVFLISLFLLKSTKFGRYVVAIGGNKQAARASGVNVKLYTTLVYILNSLFVAIAGIILAARTQSGQPAVGTGYECDAIAAVVIGGTSLNGGVGSVVGTLIGALIIGVINNGLNLLGVSSYYQMIAKGLIILIAVLLDVYTKKTRK